jgi:thiamine-monophosphate kinase
MPSPFTATEADRFDHTGETALLERIRGWTGVDARLALPFGLTDDAAVFASGESQKGHRVQAADSLVYGLHFDGTAGPGQVGHKLLARNLSDFAAMGAEAEAALLTLFLGADVSMNWMQGFYEGLLASCQQWNVCLAGGDVSGAPPGSWAASLFLSGRAERPVPRAVGRAGDSLWVSGELGGSLLGRHLDFTPRVAEGRWLARQPGVTALIDLSDGLARDLPALVPAHLAARLETAGLPVSRDASECARASGKAALEHAFSDGEDYELALVLSGEADEEAFAAGWRADFATPLTRIGVLEPLSAGGAHLVDENGRPFRFGPGYEHR